MAKITWIGSTVDSPAIISQFGVTFPLNVSVDVDDKDVLHKCWINQFYLVEGWEPRGNLEPQPVRPDSAMAPRKGRVTERKETEAKPTPPPLPEPEQVSITVTDDGVIEEGEDLPSIISGAQKIDVDGDGNPDIEIAAIPDEPEDVQELAAKPAKPPRRPRRRRAN